MTLQLEVPTGRVSCISGFFKKIYFNETRPVRTLNWGVMSTDTENQSEIKVASIQGPESGAQLNLC